MKRWMNYLILKDTDQNSTEDSWLTNTQTSLNDWWIQEHREIKSQKNVEMDDGKEWKSWQKWDY